ncbi:hypothetical protein VDG1235_478 [Verrucomicrobiia bacterium DG1235]|nr:hypothetical protein VDG1235_478 [Verrucomicrobiae bacterium DG1235]
MRHKIDTLNPPTGAKGAAPRVPTVASGVTSSDIVCVSSGGAGPQLAFFIHGTPGGASDWAEVIACLESRDFGCECLSLDRPGFGRNRNHAGAANFPDQIDAFLKLLEARRDKNRPLALVGHSYGAALALGLANRLNDLGEVSGLVLVSGVLSPQVIQFRWYHRLLTLPVVSKLAPARYRQAALEMSAVRDELEELATCWESFDFPVTLIHGDDDRLIPLANSEYARKRLREARLVNLAGAGHALTKTHPQVIADEIEGIFETILREGGKDER